MQLAFDLFLGMLAFLAGLYVDGLKQLATSAIEWVQDDPKTRRESYTIKFEDYYDGRRDG